MEKKAMRKILLKKRANLTDKVKKEKKIHHKLWSLSEYQSANTIMCYLSFGSELDTKPIIERGFKQGKTITVPKILKQENRILAVAIESFKELVPSTWGILEPVHNEEVNPKSLDLIIVPGLAFNKYGYRLGYGGGYYDRFLLRVSGFKVGLCFSEFLFDIPVYEWDHPVDLVVTN